MGRLGRVGGPFIITLGYIRPRDRRTLSLTGSLDRGCGIPILPVGYLRLSATRVDSLLRGTLCRFPTGHVRLGFPD